METQESGLQEGQVLSNIIYDRMIRNNKNILMGVVGPTGSGKSYICLRVAELWYKRYFKEDFPVENICFSIEELMQRIVHGKLPRGTLLILEEAGVNAGSLDFGKKLVKSLNYVLQSFRSKNIGILMNLPHFGMLAKQTRQLLHMVMETYEVDKSKKLSRVKPFMIQVNQTTGKVYKHYPRAVVNGFYETIELFTYYIPSESLIEAYESKKEEFVDGLAKGVLKLAGETSRLNPLQEIVLDIVKKHYERCKSTGERMPTQKEMAEEIDMNPNQFGNNIRSMKKKGIEINEYFKINLIKGK